ncbi:MAG: chromate efflux transporter [Lysobacteraceae bacterium]|nr:MAG: chromate efflux transporter [Xanthomonadaceae bacterium]
MRLPAPPDRIEGGVWEVFRAFLRLGLTSFGGPIAHLGYFRDEFVVRRRWLGESEYAELIALCQFLPGPASSQVGMAIGLSRAGIGGALVAWCGFTLPSALAMICFALGLARWGAALPSHALHGLKLAAVAVVAHAVWGMARMFCIDRTRVLLAVASALLVLWWPQASMQVGVIVLGALAGLGLQRVAGRAEGGGLRVSLSLRTGMLMLLLFFGLLLLLPLAAGHSSSSSLQVFDGFYRSGALVFGGGHVVLPLLRAEVVSPGWIGADEFLSGYGMAQAMPGPLFTFSAFLGVLMSAGPGGWIGGWMCLVAIFLPSFLLVLGVLPMWSRLRGMRGMQAALAGVNAAVVGLLLAALYDPLWTTAVRDWGDVAWVLVGVAALTWARWPAWGVVLAIGLGGALTAGFAG